MSDPSATSEQGTSVVHELLTDEQMLLRILEHCGSPVAIELNVDVDSDPTWEVSWYCVPRLDEPDDLGYGGHWATYVRATLHSAVVDAYRHVFPDLAVPA